MWIFFLLSCVFGCEHFHTVTHKTDFALSPVGPVDVILLSDVTGSMGGEIRAVKTGALGLFTTLTDTFSDLHIGVAQHRDFLDTVLFQVLLPLQNPVAVTFTNAVNSWFAKGGADTPEAQLYALQRLITSDTSWREGSTRIIVIFSDAPCHDPSGGVTLDSVITNAKMKNVHIVAIDVGNFNTLGQAQILAEETGGIFSSDIVPTTLVAEIESSIITVGTAQTSVSLHFVDCVDSATSLYSLIPNDVVVVNTGEIIMWEVGLRGCSPCVPNNICTLEARVADVVVETFEITFNTSFVPPRWSPSSLPSPTVYSECRLPLPPPNPVGVSSCAEVDVVFSEKILVPGDDCVSLYERTWEGTDGVSGQKITHVQQITVQDSTAPVVKEEETEICMWSPNHKYRTFGPPYTRLLSNIHDNCTSVTEETVWPVSCSVNQPDNDQTGDGHTTDDCIIEGLNLKIRSERKGDSELPRIYTVLFHISDICGNFVAVSRKIFVHHDNRDHFDCLL
jgi:hypothetical protein